MAKNDPGIRVKVKAGADFTPSTRLRAALAALADALAEDELLATAPVQGAPAGTGGLTIGTARPPVGGIRPQGPMPKGNGCIFFCVADAECTLCGVEWN